MTRPAAIVFDFDGTILDTEWPAFVTVRDVYERHELTLPLDVWQQRIGRADTEHWTVHLADQLGTTLDAEAYDLERRPRKNALTHEQPLRDGVHRVIGAAADAGVPLAIASSSPYSWVGMHLERRSLRDHFLAVTTIDDVESGKPAPDLFAHAAASLRVDPSTALAIEDSHHGLRSALAAGMRCVVVPNDITRGQDFSGADLVLDSLAELPLDRYGLA